MGCARSQVRVLSPRHSRYIVVIVNIMSENTPASLVAPEILPPKKYSRLKAITQGAFLGLSASIIAPQYPELAAGVVAYGVIRNTLKEFVKQQPDWMKLVADGAFALPLYVVMSQGIGELWNTTLSSEIEIYTRLEKMYSHLDFESLIASAKELRDFPEVYLYIFVFLIATTELWIDLAKMGSQKAIDVIQDQLRS
jgi:hypothetical protein